AARLGGVAAESKCLAFAAACEGRVLGANIGVLERFEPAVTMPEKFFDFDERFKIAASIFPEGLVPAGNDGASLVGALGKFAWLLGADVSAREGYQQATVEDEALSFAEPAGREAAPAVAAADGEVAAEGAYS